MTGGTYTVVEVDVGDDLAAVRQRLGLVQTSRAALVLPWDQQLLRDDIDLEFLRREASRCQIQIALISADPDVRGLARHFGLPAFRSTADAGQAPTWRAKAPKPVLAPPTAWWNEPAPPRPQRVRVRPSWERWLRLLFRGVVFLLALLVLGVTAYTIVPRAVITLVPAGEEFTRIVPVHAGSEVEDVDEAARQVPARPVGLEVDGIIEVETTGRLDVALGRTSGEVLFTNLLFQDYAVPSGTVVRTSSTSYPIRFQTTADVLVPAAGQATAPIESLADGVGNTAEYQINQLEGISASAVRVTNPQPTSGSDATEVRVVTQADRDGARELLMDLLLEEAHAELSTADFLEPGERVPRQSLVIQAVPKEAYTRFIGEQADTVGLELRLLVSGLAVDVEKATLVARSALAHELPDGYSLVEVWFDVGEIAEENLGAGEFTIFVTAHGYGSAELDAEGAIAGITGKHLGEARDHLVALLPLAQPPAITVWPEQLGRLPLLRLRITVDVLPFRGAGELAGLGGS